MSTPASLARPTAGRSKERSSEVRQNFATSTDHYRRLNLPRRGVSAEQQSHMRYIHVNDRLLICVCLRALSGE